MAEQLNLPGAGSYCCKIILGSIPKVVVMVCHAACHADKLAIAS